MRRTGIRFRLLLLMIVLATLPVVTVTWIATRNMQSSVEKEVLNANESRLMWADQYLEELIEQIDILFYTLQINEPLMSAVVETDSSDVGEQFRTQKNIRDTLTSVFYSNSRKIDDLTLYFHANRKTLTVNYANSGLASTLDIGTGPWGRIAQAPVNMYFKQDASGIHAYHSINRFEDRKLLGGVSVRINRKVWEEVSHILQSEKDSSVLLLNDEGELLSGSTGTDRAGIIQGLLSNPLPNSELRIERTKDDYIFMKRVADGQLTVVKTIPIGKVMESARQTRKAGVWTGLLFAAASALLSILFSLRISRPLVQLARTMRMTHIRNFEMTSVGKHDEIGLLQHGYNLMVQRIKELIENEYQREIEVKNAQLLALQAQINPHFLNNTLHMIGGMALMKDAPEIYRITRVIGDLLRYSISLDGETVPLGSELTHMRNYLFIQEQRFAGRCTITVEAEEACEDSAVPRFTLQPLVENAFEHGLQKREGSWRLAVRIRRIGGRVAIAIQDEGMGIEEGRLRAIREELRGGPSLQAKPRPESEPEPSANRRKGIGLKNVDSRIKLQFGGRYGIRIYSREGEGTLVVALLPWRPMRGEKQDAQGADYR